MRLTLWSLAKRGWPRKGKKETPFSYNFLRLGNIKWRDYQPREIDPPYWYKWSTESPYHPSEQKKIQTGEHIAWYTHNMHKLKIVAPDEWQYQVGDRVEITEGKDKGKRGQVIKVVPQGNIILVGGLNCEWEEGNVDQMYQRVEKPLQHHQVTLLDPVDAQPTEIEFRADEEGKRVRVSTRSGHTLPWPPERLHDGTEKRAYKVGDKDTEFDAACKVTFAPSVDNWEQELNSLFGVVDPPRRKTFWY